MTRSLRIHEPRQRLHKLTLIIYNYPVLYFWPVYCILYVPLLRPCSFVVW